VVLSNKGGIISLLDKKGLKVNGASYTKEDASRQGWTIVFESQLRRRLRR
jgi:hypothetical protein